MYEHAHSPWRFGIPVLAGTGLLVGMALSSPIFLLLDLLVVIPMLAGLVLGLRRSLTFRQVAISGLFTAMVLFFMVLLPKPQWIIADIASGILGGLTGGLLLAALIQRDRSSEAR